MRRASVNQLSSHLLAAACWALVSFGSIAANFDISVANIHNPYFQDRLPNYTPPSGEYKIGAAPSPFTGIVGDVLTVPFTLVTDEAQAVRISVRFLRNGKTGAESLPSAINNVRLLKAVNNYVEGNSNANCSCSAGASPKVLNGKAVCIVGGDLDALLLPKGCPTPPEQSEISKEFVRKAPFHIKDALVEVAGEEKYTRLAKGTELFLLDIPIEESVLIGEFNIQISVTSDDGRKKSLLVPARVIPLKIEGFPDIDVSYWSSEDPRDLVERPTGMPLNSHWGGQWWSDEHWKNLERLADLLARTGVTNNYVPLFVKNPFGISALPLIRTRCITGAIEDKLGIGSQAVIDTNTVSNWSYDFDFSGFRRWIGIFSKAGIRNFEGAHIFANGGNLPNFLECDLYKSNNDKTPYRMGVRFLSRGQGGQTPDGGGQAIYRELFLPSFLNALAGELINLGIEDRYFQHLIDENAPTPEAEQAYRLAAKLVRKFLPNTKIIDAVNQYKATNYGQLIDLPAVHLLLLYNDQGRRAGIKPELDRLFKGRRYFYNTALRRGGPNRFIDTNPLDSRLYGWLALELGYDGFLYWAANYYRYPTNREFLDQNRPDSWSPYNSSIGPLPNGSVSPGLAAGSNWILYPTNRGLTDSIRARRLRDGLLDHWLYTQAVKHCQKSTTTCDERLARIRYKVFGSPDYVGDFSRDPSIYDQARDAMIDILLH